MLCLVVIVTTGTLATALLRLWSITLIDEYQYSILVGEGSAQSVVKAVEDKLLISRSGNVTQVNHPLTSKPRPDTRRG